MKARPLKWNGKTFEACEAIDATHVRIVVPGPSGSLVLPVTPPHGWSWNGSTLAPTLRPSLLTTLAHEGLRCHSYVTDGNVEFLGDTSHDLKGQTVPLLEVGRD